MLALSSWGTALVHLKFSASSILSKLKTKFHCPSAWRYWAPSLTWCVLLHLFDSARIFCQLYSTSDMLLVGDIVLKAGKDAKHIIQANEQKVGQHAHLFQRKSIVAEWYPCCLPLGKAASNFRSSTGVATIHTTSLVSWICQTSVSSCLGHVTHVGLIKSPSHIHMFADRFHAETRNLTSKDADLRAVHHKLMRYAKVWSHRQARFLSTPHTQTPSGPHDFLCWSLLQHAGL